RPAMRRKSSAQNLLSSFKSSNAVRDPLPAPPPPAPNPIPATPTAREWDAQSMRSDGMGGLGGAGSPPFNQGASVEYLRDLVQKRIITLTYMRNVYDGRSHWFHTILLSRADLDKVFDNNSMKKRTYRFAILAMSLASLFDVSQPADLLRGLLNTLNEYEQNREEGDRQRLRLWKRPKRQPGAIGDYNMMPDASDTSYLTFPHMPFPLDYTTTLLSLLDILSALYAKISKLLGPSPFPHASQHMLGLSPHPGVSYLFQGQTAKEGENDLWEVAIGSGAVSAGLSSPPPSWTPGFGEMVVKVDGKFKKIISLLLKDLDTFARDGIKDELSSLNPLLRNM
ncbi:hypothetical protein OF83DRAFT_1025093, partial [Amylostereum chailletii]